MEKRKRRWRDVLLLASWVYAYALVLLVFDFLRALERRSSKAQSQPSPDPEGTSVTS
jgi:hypothetical protein